MSIAKVLGKITAALDAHRIAYMLVGSFASAHYGAPRSTQDIDIVIAAEPAQLQAFLEGLSPDEYYAEIGAALEALRRHSMFNVIDLAFGWKIDLIVRKSRPFSMEEFARRQQVRLHGIPLFLSSAEDAILSKLEWAKLAQSQRQIEDVAAMMKTRWDLLDQTYLERWIDDLQLRAEWGNARSIAGIRPPI